MFIFQFVTHNQMGQKRAEYGPKPLKMDQQVLAWCVWCECWGPPDGRLWSRDRAWWEEGGETEGEAAIIFVIIVHIIVIIVNIISIIVNIVIIVTIIAIIVNIISIIVISIVTITSIPSYLSYFQDGSKDNARRKEKRKVPSSWSYQYFHFTFHILGGKAWGKREKWRGEGRFHSLVAFAFLVSISPKFCILLWNCPCLVRLSYMFVKS